MMSRRASLSIPALAALYLGLLGLRDVFIGRSFGVTEATSRFYALFFVPQLVTGLVASALLAYYLPKRATEPAALQSQASATAAGILLVIMFSGLYLVLAIDGTHEATLALSILTWSAIQCAVSPCRLVLQSEGKNFELQAAQIGSLIPQLVFIATGHISNTGWLALSFVVVGVTEAIILLRLSKVPLSAMLPNQVGIPRQTLNALVLLVFTGILAQSLYFVDQAVIVLLQKNQLATFIFGTRVTHFMIGLVSASMHLLLYTDITKRVITWSSEDTAWILRLVILIGLGSSLISLAISLGTETVTSLLFGAKTADLDSLLIVSKTQAWYALQLPFYLSGLLLTYVYQSRGQIPFLMKTAAFVAICNLILDIILIKQMSIPGVALGTVVVSALNLVILCSPMIRERIS